MARITTFLAVFVGVICGFGIWLPASFDLSFLFPHFYVAAIGLILVAGLLVGQLIDICCERIFGIIYRFFGLALLALTVARMINPGGLLDGLSHVDFFVIVPLGLAFMLLWLEGEKAQAKAWLRLKILTGQVINFYSSSPNLEPFSANKSALFKTKLNEPGVSQIEHISRAAKL
ncbi:MAG: hypothetical protein ACREGA_02465 [Candidatus Saccharimonadales bacterium]